MAGPSLRSPRGLRIALFVSLALNLLVAGFVIGSFVLHGPPHRGPGGGPEPQFAYFRAFTEPERQDLRRELFRSLHDGPEGAHARRGAFAEGYRSAVEALRAEPFDASRLSGILAAQAERATTARERGQAVLVDYLASMSPDARAAYADRLEAELDRFRDRH